MNKKELSVLQVGMKVAVDNKETIKKTTKKVGDDYYRNGKQFPFCFLERCGQIVEVAMVDTIDPFNDVAIVDNSGKLLWISSEFLTMSEQDKIDSGIAGCKSCKTCGCVKYETDPEHNSCYCEELFDEFNEGE